MIEAEESVAFKHAFCIATKLFTNNIKVVNNGQEVEV